MVSLNKAFLNPISGGEYVRGGRLTSHNIIIHKNHNYIGIEQQKSKKTQEKDQKTQEKLHSSQLRPLFRGAVESMSISYDNLRRLILEAVAFGSVLFDAEAWVVEEFFPRRVVLFSVPEKKRGFGGNLQDERSFFWGGLVVGKRVLGGGERG